MGAVTDTISVVLMLTSPTAPITGAFVQRGIEIIAPRPETKVKVVEVTITGQGTTYEQAIADAKTHALNKVNGSFMISDTQTQDQHQTTRTSEYSGGVIRSFAVKNVEDQGGLFVVTIKAVVQYGKNNVVTSSNTDPVWRENIGAVLEEQQRQKQFVPSLGNQPVYIATITGVQATARANYAELKIGYNVTWSQKYVDDIKTFANTAGRLIQNGDPSTMYAVCFGTTAGWRPEEKCRDISAEIPSIQQPLYLRIRKVYANGTSDFEVIDLRGMQHQFRVVTQPGSKFYHMQSARQVKYNKGVVIFEKGSVNGVSNLRVMLEDAAQIVALEAETFNGQ